VYRRSTVTRWLAGCATTTIFPRALRIIAVTGYGQDADRLRSTEAVFDGHLAKPVSLDLLAGMLHG
jgi:CheY-like chemotaxis protein